VTTSRIVTKANGPYVVHGPVVIVDGDGHEMTVPEGEHVTLCRCGHSSTKPFCDSSHKVVDFVSHPHFRPESDRPAPTE
jgi:CDGSH-type Zn-finger protein